MVAEELKRSEYVDSASRAAVHWSGARLVLISLFLLLMYVLRMFCSLAVRPLSVSVRAISVSLDEGRLNADSRCDQYQSHSQARAVWPAPFSSASKGMCRWTMQWRTSRREMGVGVLCRVETMMDDPWSSRSGCRDSRL